MKSLDWRFRSGNPDFSLKIPIDLFPSECIANPNKLVPIDGAHQNTNSSTTYNSSSQFRNPESENNCEPGGSSFDNHLERSSVNKRIMVELEVKSGVISDLRYTLENPANCSPSAPSTSSDSSAPSGPSDSQHTHPEMNASTTPESQECVPSLERLRTAIASAFSCASARRHSQQQSGADRVLDTDRDTVLDTDRDTAAMTAAPFGFTRYEFLSALRRLRLAELPAVSDSLDIEAKSRSHSNIQLHPHLINAILRSLPDLSLDS